MRILMTTDTVGGVWTFTQELARGLLRSGCAVALVSFGRPPSDAQREWCQDIVRAWGTSFRYEESNIPLEWMPDNDQAYSDASPLLMSIAGHFKPDIFQSNQYCFGALPLRIPKVLVAHSDVLSWADDCRGGALENSEWLCTYRTLVATGLAGADYVVAPSRWMLEALGRHFIPPRKTSVISNGRSIAAGHLWRRKSQAVTAGRLWDEAKNISMLRNVHPPMPLVIAGEAREDTDVSAFNDATFMGALPEKDLLALFRDSSIYICTSIYEPFGLAPLEAAQCGCAVVANDIPSLREVWQDGALYFSDAASLTELLHELSSSTELLHVAQQKSLQRAGVFTGERTVQAYLHLFKRALARSEQAAYAA
jgi:glycosyltransferase involved in cell wall biosynthesis